MHFRWQPTRPLSGDGGRSPQSQRRPIGQSLTEFAILVPVMLALVGAATDAARLYFSWVNLEAATRDAAQYVATDPASTSTGGYYDSTDTTNYCSTFPCTGPPSTDAKTVLDNETDKTYSKASNQTSCTSPTVWAVLASPDPTSSNGGSATYPVGSAEVTACFPFQTVFTYPFVTTNGTWILRADRTVKTLVGR